MINSIFISILKPMDSWKAGAPSSQFGPSFPIAVWLVRETALTFWCYNYLYLSVPLLKVVKAAVPVTSFDFLGSFSSGGVATAGPIWWWVAVMISTAPLYSGVHNWTSSDRIRMCGINEERWGGFQWVVPTHQRDSHTRVWGRGCWSFLIFLRCDGARNVWVACSALPSVFRWRWGGQQMTFHQPVFVYSLKTVRW